ncbi:hypothetical protein GCM10020229_05170 [Kitasatospora albolonga]
MEADGEVGDQGQQVVPAGEWRVRGEQTGLLVGGEGTEHAGGDDHEAGAAGEGEGVRLVAGQDDQVAGPAGRAEFGVDRAGRATADGSHGGGPGRGAGGKAAQPRARVTGPSGSRGGERWPRAARRGGAAAR